MKGRQKEKPSEKSMHPGFAKVAFEESWFKYISENNVGHCVSHCQDYKNKNKNILFL